MAVGAQKTPVARTLNDFAQRKVLGLLEATGKSLPASVVSRTGAVVTVKFELASTVPYTLPNVTVPLIGSEFVRLPIAAGCLGWVMTADAYLGGVSGLGGGAADLVPRANLSALVFSPIGNKNWDASENENAVVIYGPDGTVIRSTDKSASLSVLKDKNEWVAPPGIAIRLKADVIILEGTVQISGPIENIAGGTYAHPIQTTGDVIAGFGTGDRVGLQTHTHTQPADSHGDTEQPISPPTAGT